MLLSLVCLYSVTLLASGSFMAGENFQFQPVMGSSHEHHQKDIRTSVAAVDESGSNLASFGANLSKYVMQMLSGKGPQEFSVSGMLKMVPIRQPTCNESIIHLYAKTCHDNGGTIVTHITRMRRALLDGDTAPAGSDTLKPTDNSDLANTDFLRSLLAETIRSSLSKRISPLIENENHLQKSIEELMQKCCIPAEAACTIESVTKKLNDLCKPGRHGSRIILNA